MSGILFCFDDGTSSFDPSGAPLFCDQDRLDNFAAPPNVDDTKQLQVKMIWKKARDEKLVLVCPFSSDDDWPSEMR